MSTAQQRWDALNLPNGTLRNLHDITEPDQLDRAERWYSRRRARTVQQVVEGTPPDRTSIQAIHRHLLGDTYEWAGSYGPSRWPAPTLRTSGTTGSSSSP